MNYWKISCKGTFRFSFCIKLQGNESFTGVAARDTANALKVMTSAVRGVAAATQDKKAQDDLIEAARAVIVEAGNLIREAKKAIANPGDPENQGRLAQVREQGSR